MFISDQVIVVYMGLLERIISKFRLSTKEATISLLGPSKAGKTTLIRYLETGEAVEEDPLSTLGVDYRNEPVRFSNLSLNLIDVGGQQLYQDAFWDFAIEQSNGLVYMIDSLIKPDTHPQKFQQHNRQFEYALNILPEDTVLMILLNKQDLDGQEPIGMNGFRSIYPMEKLRNRTFTVLPTSAKFGQGVENAFEWFVQAVSQRL